MLRLPCHDTITSSAEENAPFFYFVEVTTLCWPETAEVHYKSRSLDQKLTLDVWLDETASGAL